MAVHWEPYIDVPGKGDTAPVATLQQRMDVSLPEDIRQVLLDHAGDTAVPDTVPVGTRSSATFGPILYAGGQKDDEAYTYSVEYVLASLAEWSGRKDLRLFPFATDTASGYFCLDYRNGSSRPPIVFVDFNYDLDESSAILPVASDWQDLTGKLE